MNDNTGLKVRSGTNNIINTLPPVGPNTRYLWILLLLPVFILILCYFVTNTYPVGAGGLYLEASEQISLLTEGYPPTIDGYTSEPISFVYPPLAFIIAGAIRSAIDIPGLWFAEFAPGIMYIFASIFLFNLVNQFIEKPKYAILVTHVIVLNPLFFKFHIGSGGWVRTLALIWTLIGLTAAYDFLASSRYKYSLVGIASITFGLTLLTHPVYSAFYGTSVVAFYIGTNRTIEGFFYSSIVAVGGILFAAPWLLAIIFSTGISPLLHASQTHGGLSQPASLLSGVLPQSLLSLLIFVFWVPAILGSIALIKRRRFTLPTWLLIIGITLNTPRFIILTQLITIAAAIQNHSQLVTAREPPRDILRAVAVVIATGAVLISLVYTLGFVGGFSPALDSEDVSMMNQINDDDLHGEYIVVGKEAEWFPYLANETILIGPWGVEWTPRYEIQRQSYNMIADCTSVRCLETATGMVSGHADYVYVSKTSQPNIGRSATENRLLIQSLQESDNYAIKLENDGTAVFKVKHQNKTAQTGIPRAITRNYLYAPHSWIT